MAVGPSHPKSSLHSLSVFSIKSSSTSSSSSSSSNLSFSSKLKTVVQTFILSHLYRIARALTKAKSLVIEVLKDIQLLHFMEISIKKNKNKNKLFLGSFRMHYNWCSSHVVPVPMPVLQGNNNYYSSTSSSSSSDHLYYDSTWNTIISTESEETEDSSDLSGYLHWLEQKAHHVQDPTSTTTAKGHANDIDRLADMFIANSHEKFRLEKQESYRRFQEMMARSV